MVLLVWVILYIKLSLLYLTCFFSWRIHLGSKVSSLVLNTTTGAVTGSDVDPVGTSYDYVILSPSLKATQLILAATAQKYASSPKVTSAIDTIMSKVGKLQIAPPYKVCSNLQSVPHLTRYAPIYKVSPTLQVEPNVTKYVLPYKVSPALHKLYPI